MDTNRKFTVNTSAPSAGRQPVTKVNPKTVESVKLKKQKQNKIKQETAEDLLNFYSTSERHRNQSPTRTIERIYSDAEKNRILSSQSQGLVLDANQNKSVFTDSTIAASCSLPKSGCVGFSRKLDLVKITENKRRKIPVRLYKKIKDGLGLEEENFYFDLSGKPAVRNRASPVTDNTVAAYRQCFDTNDNRGDILSNLSTAKAGIDENEMESTNEKSVRCTGCFSERQYDSILNVLQDIQKQVTDLKHDLFADHDLVVRELKADNDKIFERLEVIEKRTKKMTRVAFSTGLTHESEVNNNTIEVSKNQISYCTTVEEVVTGVHEPVYPVSYQIHKSTSSPTPVKLVPQNTPASNSVVFRPWEEVPKKPSKKSAKSKDKAEWKDTLRGENPKPLPPLKPDVELALPAPKEPRKVAPKVPIKNTGAVPKVPKAKEFIPPKPGKKFDPKPLIIPPKATHTDDVVTQIVKSSARRKYQVENAMKIAEATENAKKKITEKSFSEVTSEGLAIDGQYISILNSMAIYETTLKRYKGIPHNIWEKIVTKSCGESELIKVHSMKFFYGQFHKMCTILQGSLKDSHRNKWLKNYTKIWKEVVCKLPLDDIFAFTEKYKTIAALNKDQWE